MADVADSYDWLYGRLLECKQKQKQYEETWDAVRQFDTDNDGGAAATAVRLQGFYHAFGHQLLPASVTDTFKSMFTSKGDGDKVKTSKADMHAMRGLLAEMGALREGAATRVV